VAIYGKEGPCTTEIGEPSTKHVDTPPSTKKGKSVKVTRTETEEKVEKKIELKIQKEDIVIIEDVSDAKELV
jgi:hypothetical protein